jgi:hypothetical protein
MSTPRIKSTAILIGYNPYGQCVYSEIMDLLDYYDGEHVWDDAASVKRLKLHKIKGYLFGSDGKLDQEFESVFDLSAGSYESGRIRFADGTERMSSQDDEAETESDAAADDWESLITLCERCHEREATVHETIVDVVADMVTNHNYCESCADDPSSQEGAGND